MLATRDKIDMPVRERRPSRLEEATGEVDENFASNQARQDEEAKTRLGRRDVAPKSVRVVDTPPASSEEQQSAFPSFSQRFQYNNPVELNRVDLCKT